MAKAATTRFLLGRRGRHLYPLRASSLPTASIFDTSGATAAAAGGGTNASGRHGVPPPKAGWNCKKQPTYVYGFPLPQQSHKHWVLTPLLLVILLLLSGCFVGAYCLVRRIDKSLVRSSAKYPTASLKASSLVAKLHQHMSEAPTSSSVDFQSIPLYLNVTIFQIPCDELTVQVVQANQTMAEESKRDRLVFKTVIVDAIGGGSTSRSLQQETPRLEFKEFNRQLQEEEDKEDKEEKSGSQEEDETPESQDTSTTGCQIMGHLQLPIANHQHQPVEVSIKANHNHDHNLSHRVDLLRLGSKRSFPKEESLFISKFQPHIYMQHADTADAHRITHHYQVQANFRLEEQQDQERKPIQTQQDSSLEIRLVFAPGAAQ